MLRKGLFLFFLILNLCACGDDMSDLTDSLMPTAIGLAPQPVAANTNSALAVGRIQGQGQQVQLIQPVGDIQDPRVVTIGLYAIPQPGQNQGGPLVGKIGFTSGQGSPANVEFDIPMGAANPVLGSTAPNGGVLISVPMSGMTVSAQNLAGVIPRAGDSQLGVVPQIPLVTAFFAVGSRPTTNSVYLTDRLVNRVGAGGLAAAASVDSFVPAFARRARVMRGNTPEAIQVSLIDQGGQVMDGPYNFAINVQAAVIDLPGAVSAVRVTNNSGGPAINQVTVLYEIAI